MKRFVCIAVPVALGCGGFLGDKQEGTTTTHVPSSSPSPVVMPSETSGSDCGEPFPTPAVNGCVVGRISCGETIQASTHEGRMNFGDDFYVYHFCTPQRHDYDESPEIAYMLNVPGDKKAIATVSSDCADLDVAIMSWDDADSCPRDEGRRLNECEMRPTRNSASVATVTTAQEYMVVVDGRNGSSGNFSLTVECVDYR